MIEEKEPLKFRWERARELVQWGIDHGLIHVPDQSATAMMRREALAEARRRHAEYVARIRRGGDRNKDKERPATVVNRFVQQVEITAEQIREKNNCGMDGATFAAMKQVQETYNHTPPRF
ncbi:MAG: hypothetical protein H8E27_01630 [Verrucomicrobia subdivision 3 bacterium]|nr:hypothetical protein [Limisphaerales bacterium]